jgi:hypothetical protein
LSADVVIQRKDIQKAPELEDGSDGGYVCESRRISNDVYEAIIKERDSLVMQAVVEGQTSSDEITASILLNQMDIIATQEAQDQTLAEILLNQV